MRTTRTAQDRADGSTTENTYDAGDRLVSTDNPVMYNDPTGMFGNWFNDLAKAVSDAVNKIVETVKIVVTNVVKSVVVKAVRGTIL